jgi:hypothetical protein
MTTRTRTYDPVDAPGVFAALGIRCCGDYASVLARLERQGCVRLIRDTRGRIDRIEVAEEEDTDG